jgi:regulator of RNase E activity RraA
LAGQDVTDEVLERFKKVGLATVYSGVSKHGYNLCFMQGVQSFTPGRRLVGRARTVRYVTGRPDLAEEANQGENAPEYRAMGSCGPGDVLIAGANGFADSAIGGDMVLLHLKIVGAEGVITDAGIRDMPAVVAYGYGVFAGAATPGSRFPKLVSHEDNVDVVCGGITVRPGDVMVAEDGDIVCVPRQHAEEVIEWAEEHEELEEIVKAMILRDGCPPGRHYNAETFERVARERRASTHPGQAV